MPFSFIILTYNSSSYIKILLDSLFEIVGELIQKGDAEIILFDNCSTDQTLKISAEYSEKLVIKSSSENLGYAAGINKAATFAKGEFFVIINPDAKLIKFDYSKILEEFKKDNLLAIAGLPIEDYEKKAEKTAGRFFNHVSFLFYCLGLETIYSTRFAPLEREIVDFVSGGFVVFKKIFFDELNGYDENYFMYVEDMDICARAKNKGLKVMFLPCALLSHKGQGSSNRSFAITNIYKGLVLFYSKNNEHLSATYVKSLLRFKATLIIFVGALFGKKRR